MERKKAFAIVISLSVLLSIPLVLSSGLVDVSQFSPGSSPAPMSSSSTASVFMDPAAISDDALQSGSYFTVYVNISLATDLYTWHAKVSWDNTLLNASEIVYGDFLAATASPNGTSHTNPDVIAAGAENITGIFNDDGYGWVAESVLGEYEGVTGNGQLLAIEFLVVGYGSTDLIISVSGTMPTMLLDSAGGTITPDEIVDGYFRNKYPGDVDGDKYVGSADAGVLNGAYGQYSWQPFYDRETDFDLDGYVGSADAGVLNGAYGTTYP